MSSITPTNTPQSNGVPQIPPHNEHHKKGGKLMNALIVVFFVILGYFVVGDDKYISNSQALGILLGFFFGGIISLVVYIVFDFAKDASDLLGSVTDYALGVSQQVQAQQALRPAAQKNTLINSPSSNFK